MIEPVPDDEYVLKLFIADYPSTALVNTTDVPTELPEEFRGCIVDFACYVLSIKLRRWKQAANYYNTYIRNLKIRNAAYMKRKVEQRAIHNIPDNVKGNTLRKEVDARAVHQIPANVKYQGGAIKRKVEQRAIHKIPDNVRGNTLRKEVDTRAIHQVPANVKYEGAQAWAH